MIRNEYYPISLGVFSIAMFLLFYAGISEAGYENLLSSSFPLGEGPAYAVAALSALLSPLFLFFALRRMGVGEWESLLGGVLLATAPVLALNAAMVVDISLLVSVLFLSLALLVITYSVPVAAVPLIVATYFDPLAAIVPVALAVTFYLKGEKMGLVLIVGAVGAFFSHGSFEPSLYIGEYSLLVPFAFALLLEGVKDKRWDEVALVLFGFAALLLSPAAGVVLLAYASALGLAELSKEKDRPLLLEFLVVYVVALFYAEGDVVRTAVLGLFGFLAFYVLAVLYKVKMRTLVYPAGMLIGMAAILTCAASLSAHLYQGEAVSVPSQETVELVDYAKGEGAAVFAYPNAYQFRIGMEAEVVDPLGTSFPRRLIVSYDSLDEVMSESPYVFAYLGEMQGRSGSLSVFGNNVYYLAVPAFEGNEPIADGELVDRGSGITIKTIAFTKLLLLDPELEYTDGKNRLVNTEGIEGSVLAQSLRKTGEFNVEGGFVVGR